MLPTWCRRRRISLRGKTSDPFLTLSMRSATILCTHFSKMVWPGNLLDWSDHPRCRPPRKEFSVPLQLKERAGYSLQRHHRPRESPLRSRIQAHPLRRQGEHLPEARPRDVQGVPTGADRRGVGHGHVEALRAREQVLHNLPGGGSFWGCPQREGWAYSWRSRGADHTAQVLLTNQRIFNINVQLVLCF